VLHEIVAGKKVADVVSEIAASSKDQASGIEQVNKAVMSMDEGTQQNAAIVEEASAASQSLSEQAAGLAQLMAHYQVGQTLARRLTRSRRRGLVCSKNPRRDGGLSLWTCTLRGTGGIGHMVAFICQQNNIINQIFALGLVAEVGFGTYLQRFRGRAAET
jgi:hypothetical protein